MNSTKKTPSDTEALDLSKAKVVGRGTKRGRHFTLRMLRVALGKTQVEIAKAAGMEQADVSRLESREDIKVSTLERYDVDLGRASAAPAFRHSAQKLRSRLAGPPTL